MEVSLISHQYDTLTRGTVATAVPNPQQGLNYKAWVVPNNVGGVIPVPGIGGLKPHTPPNFIITATDIQVTEGKATISVAAGSKSFNPKEFWFGCVARTMQGAVMLAVSCTVEVKGYATVNGPSVASKSFTFTPPFEPIAPVPMIRAQLPASFNRALHHITLQQDVLDSLWIDNLVYTLAK